MIQLLRPLLAARNPAPGGALVHPLLLLSLGVLVFNDQLLKSVWPGMLSGKLSDFSGLVLLPVFAHGLLELACARVRRPLSAAMSQRALLVCIVTSALAFALPEVWKPAELAYRYGLGALRYPFVAAWSSLHGHHARLLPVRATADVTDLLALPMALVAWRVGNVAPRVVRQASAVSHST